MRFDVLSFIYEGLHIKRCVQKKAKRQLVIRTETSKYQGEADSIIAKLGWFGQIFQLNNWELWIM